MAVGINRAVVGGHPFSYPPTPYNPQIIGTSLVNIESNAVWWREGDHHMGITGWMIFQTSFGAATLSIPLPIVDGVTLTINSSVLVPENKATQTRAPILGNADMNDSSAGIYVDLIPTYHGTSTFQFNNRTGLIQGNVVGSSDIIKYLVKIPIYEWQGGV